MTTFTGTTLFGWAYRPVAVKRVADTKTVGAALRLIHTTDVGVKRSPLTVSVKGAPQGTALGEIEEMAGVAAFRVNTRLPETMGAVLVVAVMRTWFPAGMTAGGRYSPFWSLTVPTVALPPLMPLTASAMCLPTPSSLANSQTRLSSS